MKKILIVDDIRANRLLLKAYLEEYSEEYNETFTIYEAENGREAVAIGQQIDFDFIFMDIMMPEMDGIEATRQIRQSGANAMIIAVSAADNLHLQELILKYGAQDYISKPLNAVLFMQKMKEYLK